MGDVWLTSCPWCGAVFEESVFGTAFVRACAVCKTSSPAKGWRRWQIA